MSSKITIGIARRVIMSSRARAPGPIGIVMQKFNAFKAAGMLAENVRQCHGVLRYIAE